MLSYGVIWCPSTKYQVVAQVWVWGLKMSKSRQQFRRLQLCYALCLHMPPYNPVLVLAFGFTFGFGDIAGHAGTYMVVWIVCMNVTYCNVMKCNVA